MVTSFKMLLPRRNAAMNKKPKQSETVKVLIMGLLQGCISVAYLKIKKS